MVNADQDLIHQVVYNIFDNAIKFTPENGYISFSVTEDKSAGKVTVKIRNSGQGISKEALPYIFERFYKEDSSRSVHTRGAGIGLYISKTLVQRSGGDIWAESEEGEYTEFIFTVPSAKQQKSSVSKVNLPVTSKQSKNKRKK
jgi:signal transduction histidine kinase